MTSVSRLEESEKDHFTLNQEKYQFHQSTLVEKKFLNPLSGEEAPYMSSSRGLSLHRI